MLKPKPIKRLVIDSTKKYYFLHEASHRKRLASFLFIKKTTGLYFHIKLNECHEPGMKFI